MLPRMLLTHYRYIDEIAEAYVVLRTRLLEEDTLEAYLDRLAITLDARAYGSSFPKSNEEKPAVVNELLFSGSITDPDPTICATEVQPEDEAEPVQYLYVFWKISVPLGNLSRRFESICHSSNIKADQRIKSTSYPYISLHLHP
jgi:hypothetical protein